MSPDPDKQAPAGQRPYRVYRPGSEQPQARPYRTYRSAPQGLLRRLRGEEEELIGSLAGEPDGGEGGGGRSGGFGAGRGGGRFARMLRGPLSWRRALAWVLAALVGWVALSLVL